MLYVSIEKNSFDNIFNTMMDVKNKTKVNQKTRNVIELCVLGDLELVEL